MRRTDLIGAGVLVALAVLLAWGAFTLFQWRFVAGDLYPAYSSLRFDPLGAGAFYESLEGMPRVTVSRNLKPWERLEGSPDTVLYIVGVEPAELATWEESAVRGLEQFLNQGGRLVLALAGRDDDWVRMLGATSAAPTNAPGPAPGTGPGRRRGATAAPAPDVAKRWGFQWRLASASTNPPSAAEAVGTRPSGLPERIAWLDRGVLGEPSEPWVGLYTLAGKDEWVVMERPFGRGRMVLCAGSYLFSNEALRRHRESGWLAWMGGGRRRAVFDEVHLGVVEQAGVATLLRRYRLGGLAMGLLVVGVLWIWSRAVPLVPAGPTEEEGAEVVRARDSAAGLLNLLRRHVPPQDVLTQCYEVWRRSCVPAGSPLTPRADAMRSVVVREDNLPPRQRQPLAAYAELVRILAPRRVLHRGPHRGRTLHGN